MLNSKSGIVTVEAAIFLAVVTIALVAGFNLLAAELYNPAYEITYDDVTGDVKADADGDKPGVLNTFIGNMKANLF